MSNAQNSINQINNILDSTREIIQAVEEGMLEVTPEDLEEILVTAIHMQEKVKDAEAVTSYDSREESN